MFRCITKRKCFAIDLDSFQETLEQWDFLLAQYKCIFMTANDNKAKRITEIYGEEHVYRYHITETGNRQEREIHVGK